MIANYNNDLAKRADPGTLFMHRLLVISAALFAVSLSASVSAEDLYVDNVAGDDRNDGSPRAMGGLRSGPFRTIARALMATKKGDRIILTNTSQPYRESLTLQGSKNSGTTLMPFTIVGNGAVLDGTTPVRTTEWEHVDGNVFRFQPELMHYQQLYLNGKPLLRVRQTDPDIVPDLQPLQWALVRGRVYFCVEPERVPSQYELRYARHQVGITLYRVQNVLIEGLTIQGFQLDGINAHDRADNAVIASCNVRGNGRSGISVGGVSRVAIEGCLVGDNFLAQVRTEGYCRVDISSSDLINSPQFGPPIFRQGGRVSLDGNPFAGEDTQR